MRLAIHNWIRAEPVAAAVERASRTGLDGLELSAEPAELDAGDVARLLRRYGVACRGGVTRMFGGRDLVHPDAGVRAAGVDYVRDSLDWVSELGGDVLTITPSAVGKVEALGSRDDEWSWCVEGLRACQARAADVGVRLAIEPLNRYETHLINRCDQALAVAEEVGGDCGVCVDVFHMNVEEASRPAAIALAGPRIANVHVADNNRRPPGDGAFDWPAILGEVAAAEYDEWLTLEFVIPPDRTPLRPSGGEPFEAAVRRGVDFLRAQLAP